jgi:predicted DNA-binding transcriptional regulator AlpA
MEMNDCKDQQSLINKQELPEFLSRVQVSVLLGVHPNTVDNYTRLGVFPKYTIGGTVRFKYSEVVEALLNSKNNAQ